MTAAARTCVLLLLGAVAFVAPLHSTLTVIQSHSLSPSRLTLAGGLDFPLLQSHAKIRPSIHPSRQALHCTVEPSLARTVQPSSRGNAGLTSARTEPRTDRSAPRGCYHFRGHQRVTLEVWTAKVSERIVESWKVGVIIIIIMKIWQNILRVNDLWGPLCQCTAAEMHTNKTVD